MLKPLVAEEYPLKLIKDLGMEFAKPSSKKKARYAIFECDNCSQNTRFRVSDVKCGNTKNCKSCGTKAMAAGAVSHGMSNSRIYKSWVGMKSRCLNSNDKDFKNYGYRKISVCKQWMNSFHFFYDWAMNNGYSDKLTIDRINNNGNYEPSNCRWTDFSTQNLNQRISFRNTTGFRGVGFIVKNNNYGARVNHKCKLLFNRSGYETAKDAAMARDRFITDNGLPHILNFPE